jgi:hypothetical protein
MKYAAVTNIANMLVVMQEARKSDFLGFCFIFKRGVLKEKRK